MPCPYSIYRHLTARWHLSGGLHSLGGLEAQLWRLRAISTSCQPPLQFQSSLRLRVPTSQLRICGRRGVALSPASTWASTDIPSVPFFRATACSIVGTRRDGPHGGYARARARACTGCSDMSLAPETGLQDKRESRVDDVSRLCPLTTADVRSLSLRHLGAGLDTTSCYSAYRIATCCVTPIKTWSTGRSVYLFTGLSVCLSIIAAAALASASLLSLPYHAPILSSSPLFIPWRGTPTPQCDQHCVRIARPAAIVMSR